jgi:putative signal transducing protein
LTIKRACRTGKGKAQRGAGRGLRIDFFAFTFNAIGSPLIEIVRTNDLVMISLIESLLTQEGVPFFIADQHMSAVEGSLGLLPRRIMVESAQRDRARRLLQEAGLAAELRHE